MLGTIDIEDALREATWNVQGIEQLSRTIYTSAPPIPEDIEQKLPHAVYYRLGGDRSDLVCDEQRVSVDIYAESWGDAHKAASELIGVMCSLEHHDNRFVGCDITALPYNNQDARHASIPRVSFAATLYTRAVEI